MFYVMLKSHGRHLLTEAPKPGLDGKGSFGKMLICAYLEQVKFKCASLCNKDFSQSFLEAWDSLPYVEGLP